jgi:hypothetical protein
MKVLRRIDAVPIRFGGQAHSGWLPEGAATPAPTPIEEQLLDLTIASDRNGYMLEWRGADTRHSGDTWHESLEDALHQAQMQFGIEPGDWREPDRDYTK